MHDLRLLENGLGILVADIGARHVWLVGHIAVKVTAIIGAPDTALLHRLSFRPELFA